MQKTNQTIVSTFIQQVWNEGQLEHLPDFIHLDYRDYSLPPALPPNAEGLKTWISLTGQSFEHQTIIEDQVTEGDQSIIRIKMVMKHTGPWRGIPATGREVSTAGYRLYRIKDNKIIEHHALIDGNVLENQLKHAPQGCKTVQ